jgi:hypothetical protein
MRLARLGLVLPLLFSCARVDPPVSPKTASSETLPAYAAPAPAQVDAPPRPAASVAASSDAASPATITLPGKPPSRPLHELIEQLSERDRYYFSDNYVSNETSLLQVAPLLERLPPGGAYLGVGPEQNFSYIALVRPEVAFIVDIRRRNMLLHLLYKAIFEEATTRSHFLTLLVGRPHDAKNDPGAQADVARVIEHAEAHPRDRELWRASHARLVERIATSYRVSLTLADRTALREAHQAFYDGQLDIQFELHMKTRPRYPKLRDQLAMPAPDGQKLGFLASEERFRFVQRMQAEHRIIPLVGDFAGSKALPGVSSYLRENAIKLSVFYVSNVEEFLFEDKLWPKWIDNVQALPTDDNSVFVRTWMNHHPRHPKQLSGQRTTTLIQRLSDFRAGQGRDTGWRGYRALAFDDTNQTVTR